MNDGDQVCLSHLDDPIIQITHTVFGDGGSFSLQGAANVLQTIQNFAYLMWVNPTYYDGPDSSINPDRRPRAKITKDGLTAGVDPWNADILVSRFKPAPEIRTNIDVIFYPLPTLPDLGYAPPNNPAAARHPPRERGHALQPKTRAYGQNFTGTAFTLITRSSSVRI